MKWGGSGNVSRSAVRTACPEGNPPLVGGEVTRVMSSSYMRLPLELKQDAKDHGSRLDRYSVSMHIRLESAMPKGKETVALLACLDGDSSGKPAAFVCIDSKGNVRLSDGTAPFGELDDVRVRIKQRVWYVISVAVDATAGSAALWVNGKPHCSVDQAPQIKRQGMHSLRCGHVVNPTCCTAGTDGCVAVAVTPCAFLARMKRRKCKVSS